MDDEEPQFSLVITGEGEYAEDNLLVEGFADDLCLTFTTDDDVEQYSSTLSPSEVLQLRDVLTDWYARREAAAR